MSLHRRVGLSRNVGLRRGPGPQRHTRIRPVSAETAASWVLRDVCVAIVLIRDPWCRGLPGCRNRSTDVHEWWLRSGGGDPTDPDLCIGVCRFCHDWIHDNPQAAHELGLRVWSWEMRKPWGLLWGWETRNPPGGVGGFGGGAGSGPSGLSRPDSDITPQAD